MGDTVVAFHCIKTNIRTAELERNSYIPCFTWDLMKSMMSTKFGIGQGCIWLSTPVTKSWNFSLVNAWSKTSKCRILSSDNAGKIEYLEKCEHIYRVFGTQLPCATDEKILLPCMVSMRSPSISTMKRYPVEMGFICKYKVL